MDPLITLTDRKKRILEFVVKEYIATAEPVGSRTISKNKDLGISAATIRNEMSDLEELGLLLQPHTSAGRIPSAEAYELYVTNLLNSEPSLQDDLSLNLEKVFDNVDHITTLIEESLNLLTRMTNYTAVALSQRNISKHTIKQLNIVRISNSEVVVIIVLENGEVKNSIAHINPSVTDDAIKVINNIMNENLVGVNVAGIDMDLLSFIRQKLAMYSQAFDDITKELSSALKQDEVLDIALTGATNMFDHPEFHDIERAKRFMDFVASKDEVKKLLETKGIQKDDINIVLGNEEMGEVAKDVAMISADIHYEGAIIGKIGIIAPKRMDYNKACAVVNYIRSQINSIINES
ncbi:MAG: heat-inducible transcriptional repressor HrcA [Peptostreptococcaceae bacterium]|nr:heat-inducible transcriptional repressor HrcA [Peptostreptococcaceae bacterium]